MHPSHWHKSVLTLFGCCTGRAAARKWPVVVTVAWSRGLDRRRDTAALRSGSDPGCLADPVQVAHWQLEALIGGKPWPLSLPQTASATLNVPATECDSFRCRPGDVTGRRDANSVTLTDRDWVATAAGQCQWPGGLHWQESKSSVTALTGPGPVAMIGAITQKLRRLCTNYAEITQITQKLCIHHAEITHVTQKLRRNYAKITQKLRRNYAKITQKKLRKNYACVCNLRNF